MTPKEMGKVVERRLKHYLTGDILQMVGKTDLLCFTANSTLNMHQGLVMGAGSALAFKRKMPELPHLFGRVMRDKFTLREVHAYPKYGLMVVRADSGQLVGALQTKRNWRDDSNLDLIDYSLFQLNQYYMHSGLKRADFAMPGVGHGHLDPTVVRELVDHYLVPGMYVWRK